MGRGEVGSETPPGLNKRGETNWGHGHDTAHTTKGWRGEVHGRHNRAKVPLFYPCFISPPSLQIFGGTLWITYWYWEYCILYIVERNYGSLSASVFKDGCFVLFGFCLLLYLNCVPQFRGYLIVPGFEIVGQRSGPPAHLFFQLHHVTHCNFNTQGKAVLQRCKCNSWLLFPTGGLLVRELLFFIITVSIRLFWADNRGAHFHTHANGKSVIKNTRLRLCFGVQKHRAANVELRY